MFEDGEKVVCISADYQGNLIVGKKYKILSSRKNLVMENRMVYYVSGEPGVYDDLHFAHTIQTIRNSKLNKINDHR